jgi:predicted nucleotidyltransferase
MYSDWPLPHSAFRVPCWIFYTFTLMKQKDFANHVVEKIKGDPNVIGLAAAGSWITGDLDEYSDLDLILVTQNPIAPEKEKMIAFAKQLGIFISGFTGEHVDEPRVLICLYDDPLLHVDIKFLTLPEFHQRVENPVVLFERGEQLSDIIKSTNAVWPRPDFQWIEDRFWTWVHYIAIKLGRGENFEALDSLGFLRMHVLGPLLLIKNQKKPSGLRRVEMLLNKKDLRALETTVAKYDPLSIINALENAINTYQELRKEIYPSEIQLQTLAEQRSMEYFEEIKRAKGGMASGK